MSDKIKRLKEEMIVVYKEACWINELWIPSKKDKITAHHIIPVRNKGLSVWENIALLSRRSHDYFNYIERINPRVAKELNDLFYELNRTYAPPTEQYYDEVEYVLKKIK